MISALTKQDNGTLQLTITIPASEVAKTREKIVEQMAQAANIPGFRKGKAPKKLVEDKLDNEKIKEEVLKNLLPTYYVKAVEEQKIKPIMNPKIHIQTLEEGKDWQFNTLTCETPDIDLGAYKENIQKITAKAKIIIPGKEEQKPNFDDIVKALLDSVQVTIPQILLDTEVDRLLAHTIDDIKKLGLSLDQYLSSTGRSAESLQEEYRKKAETDIKLEFSLVKIAETEKIVVEPKEVEEAVQAAKNPQEKANLEKNRYMLAQILRQQKTLDFLRNL